MRIWRLARPLASKSDINAPNTQAAFYIADNVLTRFSFINKLFGVAA